MDSKKYVIFSGLHKPNLGGIENYTLNLGKKLVEMGNNVIVATSNAFDLPSVNEEDGFTVYRMPCFKLLGGRFPVSKFNKESKRLFNLLKQEKPDCIIVNTRFYVHSLLGVRFAKKNNIPVIVLDHGTKHFTVNNRFWDFLGHIYEHFITSLVKKYCKHYYGVSQKCNEWLAHFKIKASGVIYNSVAPEQMRGLLDNPVVDYRKEYDIPKDAVVIAFTGRLLIEKGIRKLIQAFNAIQDYNIYLMIAGDGNLYDEVKQAAVSDKRVIPLGRIDFPHIAALLADTDIFCLPTDYPEGFPTSLLEAAVSKCFIVTTDCGGAKELMPSDEYGIVIYENTVENLRDCLVSAIRDTEKRDKAVQLTYERLIENFTWEKTAQNVIGIFEEM